MGEGMEGAQCPVGGTTGDAGAGAMSQCLPSTAFAPLLHPQYFPSLFPVRPGIS